MLERDSIWNNGKYSRTTIFSRKQKLLRYELFFADEYFTWAITSASEVTTVFLRYWVVHIKLFTEA